jgi:hypothetical protein
MFCRGEIGVGHKIVEGAVFVKTLPVLAGAKSVVECFALCV